MLLPHKKDTRMNVHMSPGAAAAAAAARTEPYCYVHKEKATL